MNTKKATKRALLTSVMALVMCIVMLVGTTFAWFTDTASTNVNKIVAGNLKVDIVDENGNTLVEKNKELKFANLNEVTKGEDILWEPGCRYVTQGFRIANKGNLALKWKAEINKGGAVDGKVENSTVAKDGKSLLDVIDFYVVTSTAENAEAVKIEDFVGNLKVGEKSSKVYYIKGVMQTTAGNDYQDLTLDGITITVYATQDTVENDSFNNQYDKNANVTLVTPDTAASVFHSDGGDHVRNASGTYVLTPGKYSLSSFEFCGTEPVTLIAEKGAEFGETIAVTYQSKSIKDGDTKYTVEQKGSLTVIGFNSPNSVLWVTGDAPSITVKDNTVKALRVLISGAAKDIVVENNTFSGDIDNEHKYNAYIVANTSNYDLTVKGNTFAGAGGHALHVQGNDGCANSITVTGNTFNSYGEGKAAFKIWGDTKYAPTENAELNEAAQALASSLSANTFGDSVKNESHYLAEFFGTKVSFTSTNP